jgi:mono/diheme cytochrome c family protein
MIRSSRRHGRISLVKTLLFFATLLSACGHSAPSTPASAGKAYFTQAGCASCHKIGDEGSAVGPDLTLAGFRHDAAWLDLFIKDPQAWKKDTLMPNKRISDEARKAIVEYLAAQKGEAWGGAKPWTGVADNLEKGRVLYHRAGCVGCHGPAGAGGYPNNNVAGGLIPRLNNVKETFTKAELIAKIKKGVKPIKNDPKGLAPMIAMPAWGEKLDDQEIGAVADYLLSLTPAVKEKVEF